ncbi:aminopeptidase P family protein [Sphingobium sp. DEHP117]|uniref:aminopeptidase P family protein n=1 Tax=Sphingobium sp. DEHP117 TaxID=2993436 RepID=UPI0027D70E6F|nr:M24 family metallopeptidase [Sphingobium sp. DEHP117]MDQ4420421.1 aminopeptidase P family protein [Sphingobium sp. DEHP117]
MSTSAANYADRLSALHSELARRQLDGFVVPLTDEHMSEYVGSYAQRLAWLTGFGGSAGSAVVLRDKAAIFVDGRYTLQVRDQVDGALFDYCDLPATQPADWLAAEAREGMRIGYDPWLHTREWVAKAKAALASNGAELVATQDNPVDAVWPDRPIPSLTPAVPHGLEFAGKAHEDKLSDVAEWLKGRGAAAAVLSALDSIAWALNIRGSDVARTPVALSYAITKADGTVDLFIAPEKVTAELRAHLGNRVAIRNRADFAQTLALDFAGKKVAVDPERAVAAIFEALESGGAKIDAVRDPVVLAKAIKNPTEIEGHDAAQLRDNAALVRFLHWISIAGPEAGETELSAAAKLQSFRERTGKLVDLSFDTISGAGPNGAIVHYRAEEKTNRPIAPDMLYLVDSGGQYRDGTTDITRTIAIGTPTEEMRTRFTLVLKGHIALARALFPLGTRGSQLDVLARRALWEAGLDYAHGTGHGVGSFLSVHEGPQRIATFGGGDEPLKPGMIVSNEPGYYKAGEYGIRIENLVLVEAREIAGAEKPMLGFRTLSYVPIDRALVVAEMLDAAERAWLDAYHAETLRRIDPLVEGDTRAWLSRACAPIIEVN